VLTPSLCFETLSSGKSEGGEAWALLLGRDLCPETWQILAIRIDPDDGTGDRPVRFLRSQAEFEELRSGLDLDNDGAPGWSAWGTLFFLHALDRSAVPRLRAAFERVSADDQRFADGCARQILGGGPAFDDSEMDPGKVPHDQFVTRWLAWLDEREAADSGDGQACCHPPLMPSPLRIVSLGSSGLTGARDSPNEREMRLPASHTIAAR